MRALNVATFKHAENLRANNGRNSKYAFFRHRNDNLVAENGSNNEKHRFLVVGLEKVVISGGNCQGNRKLGA